MRNYIEIKKRIESIEQKKKDFLSKLDGDLDEMERVFIMQIVTECDLRINDLNWVIDSENFKKPNNNHYKKKPVKHEKQ